MKRIQCRVCYSFCDANEEWICSDECREIRNKRNQEFAETLKEKERVRIEAVFAIKRKREEKAKWRAANKKKEEEKKQRKKAAIRNNFSRAKKRKLMIANLERENSQLRMQIKASRRPRWFRAPDPFFDSQAWQELRYQVIRVHGRRCMACGATNVEIHVDHIKPRSLYPELALDFKNLQVLCRPCNMGKSNKDETDWRG